MAIHSQSYNYRLSSRFGLHPSVWEFIHYLMHEETLVLHRITCLGVGSDSTTTILVYLLRQSR